MSHRPRLCASLLLAFATAIPAATANAPSKLSSPEDIEKEFATVPCEDKDRLAAVKALFEKAGAPADAIRIDTNDDVENHVVPADLVQAVQQLHYGQAQASLDVCVRRLTDKG